ncbi:MULTISPECIES: hypothetical protein [Kocuria]|uniref:Lipoprotein n=1 Tax=Kocuria rosea subsp. polaris TaxID=136273 RepID=A0A0A6VRR0_KOCRO|nr:MULTISPECIES: hypothetical protein [Kocuria]MCC5784074.1 hypothetical protein [Kocuria sp. CCUG 69068]EYT55463.1 hypothetical protein H488_0101800 [Kocuria sp. UCD-OTCP]KHD97685.1 hypothetical protein GY22_08225 [Kocuria polaris]NVC24316.1 hypothetical protein [Kocuria salina]PWF87033.1 hypothetical protein DEJ37_08775 [Kocuria rosea]
MPTACAPRPAAIRAATASVLLLALAGCSSSAEGDGAAGSGPDSTASAAASAPTASGGASPATVQETCARVLETVRTAPQQLRDDPAGLFTEVDELAATAPDELSGQLTSVREAVAGFRQGERSFISVVQEVRGLQERCSG